MHKKTRIVGGSTKEELENQINSHKIQAKLLQGLRLTLSCLFFTCMLSLPLVEEGIAEARRHGELTRGKSSHSLGPPHPHVWKALIAMLLREAKAKLEKADQEAKNAFPIIENYYRCFVEKPSRHIFYIRQARARKLANGEGLISWQVSTLLDKPAEIDRSLIALFELIGGSIRTGTPPPCPLKRKNQKLIDQLQEQLDKLTGKK